MPPPQVQLPPLYSVGQWQAPDPVTESILVTAARAPEASLTSLSQGYVSFDTLAAAATPTIGSLPL